MTELKDSSVFIEPSVLKTPEKPKRMIVFEHLFPKNSWDKLPPFNPLNVPIYWKRLLWDHDIQADRFVKTAKAGHGFAERVDLPFPDKLTMLVDTLEVTPSSEKVSYGIIGDLLKEGERLGGVGIRNISSLSDKALENGLVSLVTTMNDYDQFYDTAVGKIVGVLDKKGKPKAYILFKEGNRPRKAIKEQVAQKVPNFGGLNPIPINS